ncbi:MAG: hypothetical protein ABSA97_13295 [Verrucomicrobiia bacterium]
MKVTAIREVLFVSVWLAGWPAHIRNTRHIGDFRHWKDHDAYQKSFARLLRDLKSAESKKS